MTSYNSTHRFFRPYDLKATKRNLRRLRVQKILLITANVLFVASLSLGGFWLYRGAQANRRFAIRAIEVVGMTHTPSRALQEITSRYTGTNLFRLDIESLRSELVSLAWIERVAIEKKLPDTLRIQVFERTPVALLASGGTLRYVDVRGVVLDELSPAIGDDDLPIVVADRSKGIVRSVEFLARLATEAPELYSRVSEIRAVEPGGFAVFDRELATTLLIEPDDYASKWEAIHRIAEVERFDRAALEYADLRFDNRVVVKARVPNQLAPQARSRIEGVITN